MRITLILVLAGLLSSTGLRAVTISGTVYDKATNQPMDQASIVLKIDGKRVTQTLTAVDGSFSLKAKWDEMYEMVVSKYGFDAKNIIVNTNIDKSATLPAYNIYLEAAKLRLKGVVADKMSGEAVPYAHLELENRLSGQVTELIADGAGQYSIVLEPNQNYHLRYSKSAGSYASSNVFVSTVGVKTAMTIHRDVEVYAQAIAGTEPNTDDYALTNSAVATSDGIATNVRSGNTGSGKKSDRPLMNQDNFYVVDKEIERVEWTRKLQRERTENMPTIYFYALVSESVVPDEAVTTIQSEITPDPKAEIKQSAARQAVSNEEQQVQKLQKEVEKAPKVKEDPVKTFERKTRRSSSGDIQMGGLESIDEELEEALDDQDISAEPIDTDKSGMDFAEEVKSALQAQNEARPVAEAIEEEEAGIEAEMEKIEETASNFRPRRNTVYFNKGKAKVEPNYQAYLDEVAEKLNADPTANLILVAHTDNDAEYTIENYLSKLRAENVLTYLMEKGVEFDRMQIRIAGNKFPANGCIYGIECTEDEHRANRRVEVKIMKNAPY